MSLNNNDKEYVLLTAAYNEEQYIAKTIESVINQTILPKRWVIVSDGSTDRTDDIVKEYATRHGFIRFLRREKKDGRNFSAKVLALQGGLRLLADVDYSFYCTLDADVSLDKTYFQTIIDKFHENPRLGIAGGNVLNYYDNKLHKRAYSNISSVTGAVQFFRRECYESTGGYVPSKIGSEDTIIEIKAKINGWLVRSFPELHILHYRRTGTAGYSILRSRFIYGMKDYCLGNAIWFEFFKCCFRYIKIRPYIIGSVMMFCGFFFSYFKKPEKFLSKDEIIFLRKEQFKKARNWAHQRLRSAFK